MNKAGWKVVRERDGAFCSAVFSVGPWSCRYAVGKRTVGINGTPVLAFRTRYAARRFRGYNLIPGASLAVFKAKLENPRPQPSIASPALPGLFKQFWEGIFYNLPPPAPDGTLACDAITLLEPA